MSAPRTQHHIPRPRPAETPEATAQRDAIPDPDEPAEPGAQLRLRRQIDHDIRHELSTIILLATLLSSADDVGPASQNRARQILGETRWLGQLVCALSESINEPDPSTPEPPGLVALDRFAAEVVEAMQMSTLTRLV